MFTLFAVWLIIVLLLLIISCLWWFGSKSIGFARFSEKELDEIERIMKEEDGRSEDDDDNAPGPTAFA